MEFIYLSQINISSLRDFGQLGTYISTNIQSRWDCPVGTMCW